MNMPFAHPGTTEAHVSIWEDLPAFMSPSDIRSPLNSGTLVLKPGDGIDVHRHADQDEIIFVLEGAMELWLGQEKVLLHPGEDIVVPAGTRHACVNASDEPLIVFVVLNPVQNALS